MWGCPPFGWVGDDTVGLSVYYFVQYGLSHEHPSWQLNVQSKDVMSFPTSVSLITWFMHSPIWRAILASAWSHLVCPLQVQPSLVHYRSSEWYPVRVQGQDHP